MCTAIALPKGCFGRTLDLEYHYDETLAVLPRGAVLPFRCLPPRTARYALLGIATPQGAAACHRHRLSPCREV